MPTRNLGLQGRCADRGGLLNLVADIPYMPSFPGRGSACPIEMSEVHMPIYEYVCKSCGEQLEVMHKISEQPSDPCPHCGSVELERLVSAVGFRLKGGGWYETDFKSKDKQRNLAGDSGGESSSKTATEGAPAKKDAGGESKSSKSDAGPSSAAA